MTDSKSSFSGWALRVLEQTDSTNTYAARLPAWTAVRANTQTGGRGRTRDRRWVSDRGGLWLSAVVPCPGPRSTWEILPLVAGWAVVEALRDMGVAGSRLRWPNDVMVGQRKLAGLLVERFTDETAVLGIGLNVFNAPEAADPALAGATVRLADLVPTELSLDEVAGRILACLQHQHGIVLERGFDPIAEALNKAWSEPRRVAVTFSGELKPVEGLFEGVDAKGRLKLSTAVGNGVFDATQVALLREVV
jgi:BirA family biotin operon repressor/biotin-[acetyl-CoA-carboxylase] ligase